MEFRASLCPIITRKTSQFRALANAWSFDRMKAAPAAALTSSVIFALWHIPVRLFNGFDLVPLAMIVLIGLVMAYLQLRTRNVLFAGLFHGSWNMPLIGTQGDFLLMIICIIVVETGRFFQVGWLRREPAAA